MSQNKPSFSVEYSQDGTNFTDVSSDLLSLEVTLQDLRAGCNQFTLELNNEEGKYDSIFPAIPSEAGLNYYWRFKINGRTILIGKSEVVASELREDGETLQIEGTGLDGVLAERKAYPKVYRGRRGDDLIYDQFSLTGPEDVNYSSPSTAGRVSLDIKESGKVSLRDVIQNVAEQLDYDAFVDCRTKPATLQFSSKGDQNKRLNVILRSEPFSSQNNIVSIRQPRSLRELKNYLTLVKGAVFRSEIPHDRDSWTEAVYSGVDTYWVAVEGSVSVDEDQYLGNYCIKGEKRGAAPNFYLAILSTGYGTYFNPDNEDVDQLYVVYKNASGLSKSMQPRIYLTDEDDHTIYKDLSSNSSYGAVQIEVGSTNIGQWSGDTADFNWNIKWIGFTDTQTGYDYTDTVWIRVDSLYFFKSGVGDSYAKQDSASIAKYGKRELELELPDGFPWINMERWGNRMLVAYSKPLRVITLTVILDPNSVKLYQSEDAAPLFPGYSLQLKVPKWGINLADEENGTWWRILRVTHRVSAEGYFIDMDITPAGEEGTSTEDYSHVLGSRYMLERNFPEGALANLINRIRDVDKNLEKMPGRFSGSLYHADLLGVLPDQHHSKEHAHSTSDGSGQIDTDQAIKMNGIEVINASRQLVGVDSIDQDLNPVRDGVKSLGKNLLTWKSMSVRALPTFDSWGSNTLIPSINNCLAYADKRWTVTASEDPDQYEIYKMFDRQLNDGPIWKASGTTFPLTIEIDFGTTYHYWRIIGVSFLYSRYAQYVKIEVYRTNTSSWVELLEVSNNSSNVVVWSGAYNYVGKIKFTFDNPNPTYNEVRISHIYGYSVHVASKWEAGYFLDLACRNKLLGDLLPFNDDTYDLGDGSHAWKDIYLGGKIKWNDANLYRASANVLKTDDQLQASDGIVNKVVEGTVSDAYFTVNTDGLIGIDSLNGRLYFRYGGSWHYCSQDGGFSFPERTCFKCGRPFKKGDRIVMEIDHFHSDGAPHALPCHFNCRSRRRE